MDELEEIKKKKLEEYTERYSKKGRDTAKETWPDTPIHVNDGNLEQIVNKYNTVVVDCWAEWCSPCLMIAPAIEELSKEMQGKIAFAKLNVDENRGTSMKYQIMSIPTLLVFKNGKLTDRLIGAMPKEILKQKLVIYGKTSSF